MPEYRAYPIKDNHVVGVPEIVVADDDQQAVEQAKQLMSGGDIELWEGARLVTRVS
jgi:hypothetical protein